MIVERLEEVTRRLSDLGRPIADQLLPGASAPELDAAGALPMEVRDWFGWRNGVAELPGQTQGDVSLIPGYWPVSLAEAINMKGPYEGDPVLGNSWIPLLASGGGDIYAAVWAGDSVPTVAGVLLGEPTEIEFPDIETMLELFLACFDQGAYFVGEGGFLVANPDRYEEIYEEVVGGRV